MKNEYQPYVHSLALDCTSCFSLPGGSLISSAGNVILGEACSNLTIV